MAILSIPVLQNTPHWRQRVALDGSDYLLDFFWNARGGAWYMSLFAADETPLVQGLRLVVNRPLLRRFRATPGLPPGEFLVYDGTGKLDAPGYNDLGPTTPLVYFEASELL